MREIRISDVTAAYASENGANFTFKEKLEMAKLLDRLNVSVIELGGIQSVKADSLLFKSIAAIVENSTVAADVGLSEAQAAVVWEALKGAKHPRLQVTAPVSPARMEYVSKMKADKVLAAAEATLRACRALTDDVEFAAEDATRADYAYLCKILQTAIDAGATTVTVLDTAGVMLPDEFEEFIRGLFKDVPSLSMVSLGVGCSNELNLADACAVEAVIAGASEVRATALPGNTVSLEGITKILTMKSEACEATTSVKTTEMKRVLGNLDRLLSTARSTTSPFEDGVQHHSEDLQYSAHDSIEEIMKGVALLGYELSEEDKIRVYNSFKKIADRKESVGVSELEAIIASEAMQVPAAYSLEKYVVTTGNTIDVTAHVKLRHGEEVLDGLSLGDGPIDAAFLAVEKITGSHYELDDFQIQAITEGREAMGQTIVKLRADGKVYSGRGISTDIIGSGIEAYINALNKIVYEEENG